MSAGTRSSESAVELRILCWNVFHGRDEPPNPALRDRRRILPRTLDDGTYLQLARALDAEFEQVISAAAWSVCVLQETPPRWAASLARATRAEKFRCLTSRNQFRCITGAIGRRHADLIGAWEGGSNLTLARAPWRIAPGSTRCLLLNTLWERRLHERRRMCFVQLAHADGSRPAEVGIANLHTGHHSQRQTERELMRAAAAASSWAGTAPLVLAGDFNVRPRVSTLYRRLEAEYGLQPVTAEDAIDHILVRGLEVLERPARWADERRELELPFRGSARRLRLSDHAPVEAVFRIPVS
jgi:endonuclease/exonuclease/phosphatase family metal-dependent hydrolase